MAVVYLARDKKHDRPVAIKILHPEIVAGTGADRFLLEIRTLARLQHPHILALLLLHRDRDAEPTVRPRGTRRGTGPGHARHTQGSVGPDEPVTCSGDGLRAWTAPLRLPLVAGRYRRVGLPHAPAYLSCVAGLVGWPGHLRTLARVMFPRMFPTLLTRSRKSLSYREAPVGIEPTNRGFADLCLTTWLRRQAVKSHQKRPLHQVRSARQHALIVR